MLARNWLVALAVLALAVPVAQAGVVTPTYTIQELIDNHGGILTVEGQQFCFDENSVTTVMSGAAVGPGPEDIAVTGVTAINDFDIQEVGLRFNGGWSAAGGGSVDTTIRFKAIAGMTQDQIPLLWTDNSMWLSAFGVTGNGIVQITENVWADDPGEVTSPRLLTVPPKQVYYLHPGLKKTSQHVDFVRDELENDEPQTIWVVKDIHVAAAPNYEGSPIPGTDLLSTIQLPPTGNVAGMSEFYQTFSQTPLPEPATMGILALGGVILLARRRRK
jgi:hypothetical protein